MTAYEQAMEAMKTKFSTDYVFAMATAGGDGTPSVRFVDGYWDGAAFYVVTYASSQKVRELEVNPRASLCWKAGRFTGAAHNAGHPLAAENAAIREILIKEFEPWYFAHNNEADAGMCYVRIEPESGFFTLDGAGYKVDFTAKTAEAFPFDLEIELPAQK